MFHEILNDEFGKNTFQVIFYDGGISCNLQCQFVSPGKKEYLITKYGAIGDGKTLNTIAIQKAIDVANENGGGKVVVSKGIFL